MVTGFRGRARRWLAPDHSVELEAGAVEAGINRCFGWGGGWGPTVGGRLNVGDYVSVFARWEGVRAEAGTDGRYRRESGYHQGVHVGASAGSTVAVVGSGVLGAAVLVLAYVSSVLTT